MRHGFITIILFVVGGISLLAIGAGSYLIVNNDTGGEVGENSQGVSRKISGFFSRDEDKKDTDDKSNENNVSETSNSQGFGDMYSDPENFSDNTTQDTYDDIKENESEDSTSTITSPSPISSTNAIISPTPIPIPSASPNPNIPKPEITYILPEAVVPNDPLLIVGKNFGTNSGTIEVRDTSSGNIVGNCLLHSWSAQFIGCDNFSVPTPNQQYNVFVVTADGISSAVYRYLVGN